MKTLQTSMNSSRNTKLNKNFSLQYRQINSHMHIVSSLEFLLKNLSFNSFIIICLFLFFFCFFAIFMIGPYQLMYWQCRSEILSHDVFSVCSPNKFVQRLLLIWPGPTQPETIKYVELRFARYLMGNALFVHQSCATFNTS